MNFIKSHTLFKSSFSYIYMYAKSFIILRRRYLVI